MCVNICDSDVFIFMWYMVFVAKKQRFYSSEAGIQWPTTIHLTSTNCHFQPTVIFGFVMVLLRKRLSFVVMDWSSEINEKQVEGGVSIVPNRKTSNRPPQTVSQTGIQTGGIDLWLTPCLRWIPSQGSDGSAGLSEHSCGGQPSAGQTGRPDVEVGGGGAFTTALCSGPTMVEWASCRRQSSRDVDHVETQTENSSLQTASLPPS